MAPTVNEMMEAYALDDLDYSVESVEHVNQILERFHDELPTESGRR
jgi:hypothetical protein